jgi:glutathione-regulated potassium-efflux system ancillary protein KefC
MALTATCVGMAAGFACERWHDTLMMSTCLTFGTISALYGFSHGVVSREQYSFLVAVVIASAVIPTLVATFAFTPRHLLPAEARAEGPAAEREDGLADE